MDRASAAILNSPLNFSPLALNRSGTTLPLLTGERRSLSRRSLMP